MIKNCTYFIILTACCFVLCSTSIYAKTNDSIHFEGTRYDSTNWLFELPLWIPGFRGAFSYGDITVSGDNTGGIFNSIFKSKTGLDFYLVGKVRYSGKRIRLQADVFGGKINNSVEFNYGNIPVSTTDIATLIPRVYAGFKIFSTPINRKYNNNLNIWFYAGARNYRVNIESQIPGSVKLLYIDENWVEPLIGISIPLYYKGWAITYQTDLGGFGIDNKTSWWMQVHGRYQFNNRFSVCLGWVVQDAYYKTSLIKDFKYDVRLSGPLAGLSIYL